MKIHRKFKLLYTGKNRYSILTGGRGSGKSFAVSDFLLRLSCERGHVILFTRYTLTSASISIIPEFREKIEIHGIENDFEITKDSIVNKKTGSVILFRGIRTSSGNQTANLKSIQGVTTWVLDEAEELTDEKVFDKIDDSIRARILQNRVILILNPTTAEHWIYKRFFEGGQRPDVTYIHTSYLDNIENLSDSFIEKAEKVKSANLRMYEHRYLGAWIDVAENAIFPNFTIGEFDSTLPLWCFGQDYGFSNDPTTLIKIAVDKAKKIVYLHECLYAKGLNTAQIFTENSKHAGRSVIVADGSEPRLISELSGRGLLMQKANKPPGSVSGQIKLMQDYAFVLTKDSVNLQKEFKNYVWLANDIPIDDFNHGIDAARYAFDFLTNKGTGKYIIS